MSPSEAQPRQIGWTSRPVWPKGRRARASGTEQPPGRVVAEATTGRGGSADQPPKQLYVNSWSPLAAVPSSSLTTATIRAPVERTTTAPAKPSDRLALAGV